MRLLLIPFVLALALGSCRNQQFSDRGNQYQSGLSPRNTLQKSATERDGRLEEIRGDEAGK